MPRIQEDVLSGNQKAAILLIALGPEKSAMIFKHLKEDLSDSLTLDYNKRGKILVINNKKKN